MGGFGGGEVREGGLERCVLTSASRAARAVACVASSSSTFLARMSAREEWADLEVVREEREDSSLAILARWELTSAWRSSRTAAATPAFLRATARLSSSAEKRD